MGLGSAFADIKAQHSEHQSIDWRVKHILVRVGIELSLDVNNNVHGEYSRMTRCCFVMAT